MLRKGFTESFASYETFGDRPVRGRSYFHETPHHFLYRNQLYHPVKVGVDQQQGEVIPESRELSMGLSQTGSVRGRSCREWSAVQVLAALALGIRSDVRDLEARPLTPAESDYRDALTARLFSEGADRSPTRGSSS